MYLQPDSDGSNPTLSVPKTNLQNRGKQHATQ
jgi:hypothetical protein